MNRHARNELLAGIEELAGDDRELQAAMGRAGGRIQDAQAAWDALEDARKVLKESMKPQKRFSLALRRVEELVEAVAKAGPFGGEEPDPGIMRQMDDEMSSFYKHYDESQQALGRLEAHMNWAIGSGY